MWAFKELQFVNIIYLLKAKELYTERSNYLRMSDIIAG